MALYQKITFGKTIFHKKSIPRVYIYSIYLEFESAFESGLLENASSQLLEQKFTKIELHLSILYLVSIKDSELDALIGSLCKFANIGLRFYRYSFYISFVQKITCRFE